MSHTQVPAQQVVYLLEVLTHPDGDTASCDNFAKLETAVEAAFEELRRTNRPPAEVEVTLDKDGEELEGIAFLNTERELLALITAYHMERDTELAKDAAVRAACRRPLAELAMALNALLRH